VREAVIKIADYRLTRANQNLFLAAQFHDIGKLAVPKCLLNTDSQLLPAERKILEQHQIIGYLFLRSLKSLERVAAVMRFTHVEKGYPEGIENGKVPFDAHFLIIADCMDACLLDREYRRDPCLSKEQLFEELVSHKKPRHPLKTLTATARVLGLNYSDASRILGKVFYEDKEIRLIEKMLG